MANNKSVILKIKRQLTPDAKPSWEEFEIPYKPNMNITSALMEVAANPVTRDGKQTTPVTYDSNCLEEICGSCAMIINGRARMACSTLIDHIDQPIKLEPFSKFPVVRDLAVDRSVLFENLKKVKAWVPVDGTTTSAPARVSPRTCRKSPIPCRIASPAAAAWKPARNSPKTRALSARPLSLRCACSTTIPPAKR